MQRFAKWSVRHPGEYQSIVEVLLSNRSLTPEDISNSPDVLQDPCGMQDMGTLTRRILDAIERNERIVVFGDYDVDGVTSTAVLLDFLDKVGADVMPLLPDRFRDGYGMKPGGVQRALDEKASLIVTADNGIASFDAVDHANASGVDVVVIDHHSPQEKLPEALAIVNPNRLDCTYSFKGLAAVGVAFKVVQALVGECIPQQERRSYLNSLLDLVALGTVADVAPMVSENRVLTRRGLQVLAQTERPGLRALKEASGTRDQPVDTTTIGFFLGPRINSAGRLASADLALNLLRSKSGQEAEIYAEEINDLNQQRQQLQKAGVSQAEMQVEAEGPVDTKIVVVKGDDWHLGVIGLISGRLTESYRRPSVVCTEMRDDDTFTGSARSAGGYNMVEGIFRCADLLTEYGGHAEAAGFTGPTVNFPAFKQRLEEDADARLSNDDLTPCLELDAHLLPHHISLQTIDQLDTLAPFGSGNEPPLFLVPKCQIERMGAVGKGAHLKLSLDVGGQKCDAIWWRQGERVYELSEGDTVDVACALEKNTWNGKTRIQLVLEDLRSSE
ncbi:MAG: single-stranded-DNA-specific exonuclease RecJ [Gemmatimonadetes bacterium]|nr:single-stranded-DNA-specific exonuclease RecJ [Gemmatimonadota bacterium]